MPLWRPSINIGIENRYQLHEKPEIDSVFAESEVVIRTDRARKVKCDSVMLLLSRSLDDALLISFDLWRWFNRFFSCACVALWIPLASFLCPKGSVSKPFFRCSKKLFFHPEQKLPLVLTKKKSKNIFFFELTKNGSCSIFGGWGVKCSLPCKSYLAAIVSCLHASYNPIETSNEPAKMKKKEFLVFERLNIRLVVKPVFFSFSSPRFGCLIYAKPSIWTFLYFLIRFEWIVCLDLNWFLLFARRASADCCPARWWSESKYLFWSDIGFLRLLCDSILGTLTRSCCCVFLTQMFVLAALCYAILWKYFCVRMCACNV